MGQRSPTAIYFDRSTDRLIGFYLHYGTQTVVESRVPIVSRFDFLFTIDGRYTICIFIVRYYISILICRKRNILIQQSFKFRFPLNTRIIEITTSL